MPRAETNPTLQRFETTRQLPPTEPRGGGPASPGEPQLVLDRYRPERRIGAGGHGSVWQAFDEKLEREVALKVIPRGGGPTRPRAEREARVAARLNHPGIVALYEFGEDEDSVYLVSELVRGRTLAELERAGAVSDRDVARIGVALCEALAHAHRNGVVHRDVKPQNVLVVAEPAAGAGFAKLTDFGVAHAATDEPLTRTGDVVGTIAYMAPEQADGRAVTAAADVYALALVLYEAWTGVNPRRRASIVAPAVAPASLGRLRRDLPAALCQAIDAALDPRPERRPPLARLERSLREIADGLSDEGGLVEPGTLERLGLASAGTRLGRGAGRRLAAAPVRGLSRLGAGLAAGALTLAALERLGPSPPFAPLAAAAAVTVAVAVLPRIAWLAAAAGVCLWLASPGADREGSALLLAAALAPTPLLMPRAGALWSVPALAPLLGLAGLSALFVAVAGLARTPWRRAGLAAAGFLWLAAAEIGSSRTLLFGAADGTGPRALWQDSLVSAAADALYPTLTSPALLPLLAWSALAAVLPVLVRGRTTWMDVGGAAVWATALVLALGALAGVLGESARVQEPRGALAGAVLGGLVAIAVARLRRGEQGIGEATLP